MPPSAFSQNNLPLEALGLEKMFSGALCLTLTEKLDWEDIPEYAGCLAHLLEARIGQKTDAAWIRLWTLHLGKAQLYLAFDDFPVCISLEPVHGNCDDLLRKVYARLLALRDQQPRSS